MCIEQTQICSNINLFSGSEKRDRAADSTEMCVHNAQNSLYKRLKQKQHVKGMTVLLIRQLKISANLFSLTFLYYYVIIILCQTNHQMANVF